MVTNVRFFLSYDPLNAILSPSIFVYYHDNLQRLLTLFVPVESFKIMCGYNIIYDMTLSNEYQYRHMINQE